MSLAGGDYTQWQFHYRRVVADVDAAASPAIVPTSANHQIFIQKIMNAGTATATIVDDAPPAPVLPDITLATVPSATLIDFGPIGTPVRVGASVNVTGALAGGRLHIEGYEKIATAMPLGNNNL